MKLGDHIRVTVGGRTDHAIDCGDNTVIHLAPAVGERFEVRRSLLNQFALGAERVEVVPYGARGFPPAMVVGRAFSRLGATATGPMFASPEHFAVWCVNGLVPAAPHASAPAPAPGRPPAAAPAPTPARPARKHGGGPAGAKRPARAQKPAARKARAAPRAGRKTPSKTRPARKSARRRRSR
jgi:hypothetical protein